MQNSPIITSLPPPFQFPPPPQSAGQVVVLPAPPPPFRPFAIAPSSVFQITVLPAPPQPPPSFPVESSSVDLSPLEFLLALIAIIAIPALIYTFIFAYGCSSSSSDRRRSDEVSDAQSVASELSRHDIESVPAGELTGKKHQETRPEKISGECPVCLSVFADGEEVRELSVCKHSFHSSCIDLWLSNHSNCPICRTTVTDAATVKSSGNGRDDDVQPDIEDSFEVESETIEHSLDSTTTVEEIVEESDIECEDEGRQPIIRRKMQIWNEKDAKEITEVNSRDGSHSTSGSLDMIDNLHELNKDAEEELNKDAEEEEPFSLEREAVKDEVMNVLRIYFHRV